MTISCTLDCGFGQCDQNKNVTSCICESGWSQSVEFAFDFDSSKYIANTLTCDVNEGILQAVYAIGGLVALLGLLLHVLLLKTWKKTIRLIPTLSCMLCITIYSLSRAFEPAKHLFGIDVFFTILFSVGMFFSTVAGQMIYMQFIHYLLKKYPFLERLARGRFSLIQVASKFMIIQGGLASILLILIPFYPGNASSLFAAFNIHMLIYTSYGIFSAIFLVGFYIQEIEMMISDRKDFVELDMEFKIKLRRLLPRLKSTKNHMIFLNVFFVPVLIITLIPTIGFTPWKYYVPLFNFLWAINVTIYVRQQIVIVFNKTKQFAKLVSVQEMLEA